MKNSLRLILAPVAAVLFLGAANVNAAETAASTNPKDMTCQEYIDLNPKAMMPVAFWAINEDTLYKGGDTVDFDEVNTVAVPELIKLCQQKPESKLMQWIDSLK